MFAKVHLFGVDSLPGEPKRRQVIHSDGISEAFGVSEHDIVKNGEIKSDACLPHARDCSGELVNMFMADSAGRQVGG